MKRSRMVLGAVTAPAVLPAAYTVLALWFSRYSFGAQGHMKMFLVDIFGFACICYVASYLLGAPVIAGLLAARRLTFLPCVALSALAGAAAAVAVYAVYRGSGSETVLIALLGGVAGLLVSLVFCAVAGVPWRR